MPPAGRPVAAQPSSRITRSGSSAGWPVAMLIGTVIPRHWVLIVDVRGDTVASYEPSSGEVRTVGLDAVRRARLTGLGYPRPFAFVVPGPLL